MLCHECARSRAEASAVGQCRFCSVGLCKDHLVASFRSGVAPQYWCEHHPELPFADFRGPKAGRLVGFALVGQGA